MQRSLEQWLEYQLAGAGPEIVMGLGRVRAVADAMRLARPAPLVISVAGTNGKGSTVAYLEAMAGAGGLRVGAYTSPHLLRYNERIRIDSRAVGDDDIRDAFERIESARLQTGVALTYFEYGTLAALDLFARARLDLAILEVGLGGRLDAVNLVDADAAIVTAVDLDHQAWLGEDRESIGREKAGIFRPGAIAVLAERVPPASVLRAAHDAGARIVAAGIDYDWSCDAGGWTWHTGAGPPVSLPFPQLQGEFQLANASAAIACLDALRERLSLDVAAIVRGIERANLCGRLQLVRWHARDVLLDVAHNPQAARTLATHLSGHCNGEPVTAVFGSLTDKDVESIVAALAPQVSHWFCAGLDGESARGCDGESLCARVSATGASASAHATPAEAWHAALACTAASTPIAAFGSFLVVAAMLSELGMEVA